MSVDPKTLSEVRQYFGLPSDALIIKDWHVIRAVNALATLDAAPLRLVFGGGTALARAYRLIRRMSEDVDFKIAPAIHAPSISKAALYRQLGELREKVSATLAAAGFILDVSMPHTRNGRRYMLYHLPYEGEDPAATGLRQTIQVELSYAPLRLDPVRTPVASLIAEALQREPEVASVECVSLTETAAEKLVAVTRRTAMRVAGLSRDDDPALVRHIYDLHSLREHYEPSMVVELARAIIRHDAEMFANQYPAYRDDPMRETRTAMTALASDPVYAERYAQFQRNMVYRNPVAFTEALATLRELVSSLE